jgi:hypothetical protein
MAKRKTNIEFAEFLDDLFLDPLNPRLGRTRTNRDLPQDKVLELMRDWNLDELAESFIENGFWPQEALIVVEEKLYGKTCKVVVEGNRRLAALKYLKKGSIGDESVPEKWRVIVEGNDEVDSLFRDIPYIKVESRKAVEAYIGFRHVTGIMPWKPPEKAEYIAKLIDESGMDYNQVMREIGSQVDPVRRNYISYRILRQMENLDPKKVSIEKAEKRFSVLFLSLREIGTQQFLEINLHMDPESAKIPVPKSKLENLADFALWLFGTEKRDPLFSDSRNIGRFGRVLQSPIAVEYLRSSSEPNFEIAIQKAGADEPELIDRVEKATTEIEIALSRVHLYTSSKELSKAVDRFTRSSYEIIQKFPTALSILDQVSANRKK